jgi:hypothetical protein
MIKRFPLFLLLVVLLTSFAFAQTGNVKSERMQIPDPQFIPEMADPNFVPNIPLQPGDEFLQTGYDYMCNNATRDMINLVDLDADGDLDPIMAAMERFGSATGDRWIYFGYKAFGLVDKWIALDPANIGQGWPDIQYCVGGPLDGNALLMGHFNTLSWHSVHDLTAFAPVLPWPTVTFGANFPQFAYTPDAIIAVNGSNDTQLDLHMYVSTDVGATFTDLGLVGFGDSKIDVSVATDWPSELPVQKSADNMTIATYGWFEGANTDPAGNIATGYWFGSTDGGATWDGLFNGFGNGDFPEYGQVVNRDPYAPFFSNFSQISLNLDDMGVSHITCNGYGEGAYHSSDTLEVFPMLYWNSNNQEWIAVTTEGMETREDGFGAELDTHRPGNGIGNAYGTTALSEDGNVVFLAWQGPEYTGDIGNSAVNLYTGTNTIFYTDIYYVLSEDGGATWTDPAILQGEPGIQESYPVLAPRLEIVGDQATAHFLYLDDAIPGTSLFASNNEWSDDCMWYYQTFNFTVVGVDDETVVNSFNLEQNYPNPFNPTTSINYTLAERSSVSLKVFDVLGNEVATLVNSTQEAGAYDVNFDASQLSSGLYIYTLNAGDFTSSKKMMLLK